MASRRNLAILFIAVILIVGIVNTRVLKFDAPRLAAEEVAAPPHVITPIAFLTPRPILEPTATPLPAESPPGFSSFVKVKDTEYFTFYAEPNSYALRTIDDFANQSETLLLQMSDKLGEKLNRRVTFYLYSNAQGSFSALSFAGSSLIYEQDDAGSSKLRIEAVTAHELVHQITFQVFGYPQSTINLEGIAHWASEPWWVIAEGRSFDDRVRRYVASSKTLPLNDLVRDRSLWKGDTQQVAYDEAGSFVGYLIRNYGLDKFKRVYMKSNYDEVYGKGLAELEKDWLSSLRDR